jgi:hypothetical protein
MLALLLAELPLPNETDFKPGPGPYITLLAIGFAIAVLGHIASSKTLIATGLLMIFSATIIIPVVIHLAG